MSHRSPEFEGILANAEKLLRELLSIPENYRVLFLQGGASNQFSMVPLNFLPPDRTSDYLVTGAWAKKAVESAKLVGKVVAPFDDKASNYRNTPDWSSLALTGDAAYVHITTNETIQGVEYEDDPVSVAPLVCDMSSDIISRPVAIERYALIYAGAQKNMGPAGLTIVIIRDDMVAKVPEAMHPMMDYRLLAKNGSMYNTPPTWSIYVTGLVLQNLVEKGGVAAAASLREQRSAMLYAAIDQSDGFYCGHASARSRSKMNVTFTLRSDELTNRFIEEAERSGMSGLAGHRSVGGIRASIYNAFPVEGSTFLATFMEDFAKRNR